MIALRRASSAWFDLWATPELQPALKEGMRRANAWVRVAWAALEGVRPLPDDLALVSLDLPELRFVLEAPEVSDEAEED